MALNWNVLNENNTAKTNNNNVSPQKNQTKVGLNWNAIIEPITQNTTQNITQETTQNTTPTYNFKSNLVPNTSTTRPAPQGTPFYNMNNLANNNPNQLKTNNFKGSDKKWNPLEPLIKTPEIMKDNNRRFEDGYQFGDVTGTALENLGDSLQTIAGTAADAGLNLVNGAVKYAEGMATLPAGMIAQRIDSAPEVLKTVGTVSSVLSNNPIIGAANKFAFDTAAKNVDQEKAHKIATNIRQNIINDVGHWLSPKIQEQIDKVDNASILGEKSDEINQGIGQLGGLVAMNTAMAGAGVPTNIPIKIGSKTLEAPVIAAVSGASGGLEEAYKKGGVDIEPAQAWSKALTGAVAEGVSEGIFGMFGVGGVKGQGGQELSDVLIKKVVPKISNNVGKMLAKIGISATGEGAEEIISYFLNWIGDNAIVNNLGSTDFSSEFSFNEAMQEAAMAFIETALSAGVVSGVNINAQVNDTVKTAEKALGRQLTVEEKQSVTKQVEDFILTDGEIKYDPTNKTIRAIDRYNYKQELYKDDPQKNYLERGLLDQQQKNTSIVNTNKQVQKPSPLQSPISQVSNNTQQVTNQVQQNDNRTQNKAIEQAVKALSLDNSEPQNAKIKVKDGDLEENDVIAQKINALPDLDYRKKEFLYNNYNYTPQNGISFLTDSEKADKNDPFFMDSNNNNNNDVTKSAVQNVYMKKGDNLAKVSLQKDNNKMVVKEILVKNQNQGYEAEIVNAINEWSKIKGLEPDFSNVNKVNNLMQNINEQVQNNSNVIPSVPPINSDNVSAQQQDNNSNQIAQDVKSLNLEENKPEVPKTINTFVENRNKIAPGLSVEMDNSLIGSEIDGVIERKNGKRIIKINPESNRAYEFVVMHEMLHDLDGTEEFKQLKEFVMNRAKTHGTFDETYNKVRNQYEDYYKKNNLDLSKLNVETEAVNDMTARAIGNEEFLTDFAKEKPNVFKKIYNWIKNVLLDGQNTGKSFNERRADNKFLQELKSKFEKAYNAAYKGNDSAYSISSTISEDIDNILNNIYERNPVKLRDNTPSELVKNGVKDLPMYENPSHIRKNILTEAEARKNGIQVNTKDNYHGLGKEIFIKAIDSLDDPRVIFKNKNDPTEFFILTIIKDSQDNNIVIPIKINQKTTVNKIEIDNNRIKSVYGYDKINPDLNEYIKYQINHGIYEKIYEKKKPGTNNTSQQISNSNIPQNNNSVNLNSNKNSNQSSFSLSEKEDLTPYDKLEKYNEDREEALKRIAEKVGIGYTVLDANKGNTQHDMFWALQSNSKLREQFIKENNIVLEGKTSSEKYDLVDGNPKYEEFINNITDEYFKAEKPNITDEELMEIAQDIHGITDDYSTGAYMTIDGQLLDFDDGGYRDDHRTLGVPGYTMEDFIDAGNIRMQPEGSGFEVSVEPTEAQYERLKDYIDNYLDDDIYVDIGSSNDSKVYPKGTDGEDIIDDLRYYFKNGEFPNKGEYSEFYSISNNTEEPIKDNNRTLLAEHNLSEEKLNGILDLGGFPVPSIAVTEPNKVDHSQFGDITVVFNKSAVDPSNPKNSTFDRDVWSSTFPTYGYDINGDAIWEMEKANNIKFDYKDDIQSQVHNRYFDSDNLKDFVNRRGNLEEALKDMKKSNELKYVYAKTTMNFEPIYTEKSYSRWLNNKSLQKLNEMFPEQINMNDIDSKNAKKYEDIIIDLYTQEMIDEYNNKDIDRTSKMNEFADKHFRKLAEDTFKDNYGRIYDVLFDSNKMKYDIEKNNTKKINQDETLKKANEEVNQKDFEAWIDNTFGKMFANTKKGIRNDKEIFTPSGNRRKFNQLYDEYNLENIVKAMTKGKIQGGEGGFTSGSFGEIQAKRGNRFNSIEDIRNAKGRLTNAKEAKAQLEPLKQEIQNDISALQLFYEHPGYYFSVGEVISEFAEKKQLTVNNFMKFLDSYGGFNTNPNTIIEDENGTEYSLKEVANKIIKDLKSLDNIMTDYFESKPQRAVGFDEVEAVVVPKDISEKTKQRLKEKGLNVIEYDPEIEGDRQRVINSLDDYKFSQNNGEWNDYLDKNWNLMNKPLMRENKTNSDKKPTNSLNVMQKAERNYKNEQQEKIAKDSKIYNLEENKEKITKQVENDDTLPLKFRDKIVNQVEKADTQDKINDIKQQIQEYKDNSNYVEEDNKKEKENTLIKLSNMNESDVDLKEMKYKQQKDLETKNERKFFENAKTSPIVAEETKNRVNENTYEIESNDEVLKRVKKKLDQRGNDMVDEWKQKTKDFNSEDVALGAILIERYQQKGDWNSAARTVEKLADMGTEAGRVVQMYSIFQRLSPETMAIYQQKELNKAFEQLKKKKTGEWVENNKDKFKLTPEDTEFIYNQVEKAQQATDEETKQRELSKIEKRINEKLPSSAVDALKAWRRIAMLFNFKTQVRNVGGNASIMPVNIAADAIGTQIDKLLAKTTGTRTTNYTDLKEIGKGLKKGLQDSITDYKTGTRSTPTGSKYEFEFGAKPFDENTKYEAVNNINRKLNGINNLLSAVMSGGDRPFYEAAFNNSLQGQMKANNVTVPTQDMIDIAVNEALSRTWNDDNNYTKTVLGIRKAMNRINIKGFGLGDLIIPFAKTPANLTKAMVEYSPAGFIKSYIEGNDLRKAISRGEFTPQQQKNFVTTTSKAITGTILYAIAGTLAKLGIITGSKDDDKDVANFEQYVLGIQPYSIKIGDKTYTYSWANPINAPLAIMADTYKMKKEDASTWEILRNAFKVAGDTLVDNSFLQGIKELFDDEGISEGVIKSIESFPASLVPTLSSQIASAFDDKRRITYEYKKEGQSTLNGIKYKTPGLRNELTEQVNTFGETIENQNNPFDVFLNPANVREARTTKTQRDLYSLYKETQDKTIFPRQAPNYFSYQDEKHILSSKEKATYQRAMGTYAAKQLGDLFNSDYFKKLDNETKIETINKILNDSTLIGKASVGVETKDYLSYKDKMTSLEKTGVSVVDYYNAYMAQKDVEGTKDANGKTILGTEKTAKLKAIQEATEKNLTQPQLERMYGIFKGTIKSGK